MKKVPLFVWYNDYKYKVIKFYHPTKFDGYLLCLRKEEHMIHADSQTEPIEMILLDIHNDEFYASTKRNDKLIKELFILRKENQRKISDIEDKLTNIWLDSVIID